MEKLLTIAEHIEWRVSLFLTDRPPFKGATQENLFPRTQAHRPRIAPKPVRPAKIVKPFKFSSSRQNPFSPIPSPSPRIIENDFFARRFLHLRRD
jgi:hypothetical protein